MNHTHYNLISNSCDYAVFASLFEDFEIIDKLTRKHLEEENLPAVMRCLKAINLIFDDLKQYTLK